MERKGNGEIAKVCYRHRTSARWSPSSRRLWTRPKIQTAHVQKRRSTALRCGTQNTQHTKALYEFLTRTTSQRQQAISPRANTHTHAHTYICIVHDTPAHTHIHNMYGQQHTQYMHGMLFATRKLSGGAKRVFAAIRKIYIRKAKCQDFSNFLFWLPHHTPTHTHKGARAGLWLWLIMFTR